MLGHMQAAGLIGPTPSKDPLRAPARSKAAAAAAGKQGPAPLTNSMQQEQLRSSIDHLDTRLLHLQRRMQGKGMFKRCSGL